MSSDMDLELPPSPTQIGMCIICESRKIEVVTKKLCNPCYSFFNRSKKTEVCKFNGACDLKNQDKKCGKCRHDKADYKRGYIFSKVILKKCLKKAISFISVSNSCLQENRKQNCRNIRPTWSQYGTILVFSKH